MRSAAFPPTAARRLGLAAALLLLPAAARADDAAPADQPAPATRLLQDLRRFRELGTMLHIGAHPDDENTQLIAYFARGRGFRAAYLSLTRGDGGQNEIGRDLDERLGVVRTQELLAARRLDGGRQFFTRAIDFGYSKTPEETLQFWDRTQVLGDVVRVIRQFRPDVIVTRFPVPPGSGGHGHHTASAMLAVEAFTLAGDPQAYPEQVAEGLAPWRPKRIVWNEFGQGRGAGGPTGPSVQVDIGGDDPVTGEPFGTIANRSRGMHKTQGLGGFSGRTASGPNVQSFLLLGGEPATKDLFDGVDTSWNRLAGGAAIGRMADELFARFQPADPAASVPAVLALRTRLAALPADPLLDDKRAQLDQILQQCLGLQVETSVEKAEFVPGEKMQVRYRMSVADRKTKVRSVDVRCAALDQVKKSGGRSGTLRAGGAVTGTLTGTLPAMAPLTQPYWLREEGNTGIFRVDDPKLIGRPESPPAVEVEFALTVEGQTLVVKSEPVPTAADDAAGPARPLAVVPPVTLAFASEVFVFAPGTGREIAVEVSAARAGAAGKVQLEVPDGWQVRPDSAGFKLAAAGDKARAVFQVTAPAGGTSTGRFTASADIGGRRYANGRFELRYDHLPLQLLQPPARARTASFEMAVKVTEVGYLPGAGDYIAECLEQMGCHVTRLTPEDLNLTRLYNFEAIVIGVRAFNERKDLEAKFPIFMTYLEAGGVLVALYNRPDGLQDRQLGPFPLSIQGPAAQLRVTDERAPVTFLDPDHSVLNSPNKISPADFDGWVQERGAYFPSSWDEDHYTPILAMSDPGEPPLKSSLLVAQHGQGSYVYTGLSFFRQLPAGVPGAYRLFANLISLGK